MPKEGELRFCKLPVGIGAGAQCAPVFLKTSSNSRKPAGLDAPGVASLYSSGHKPCKLIHQ
jgi:hypothetical protein